MKKHILLLAFTFAGLLAAHAQTKIKDGSVTGSALPNANALLELESNNKGFLLPRVTLSATTAFTPLTAHIAGMTVYNTATAGDVTPGYYYNDGARWVKLSGAGNAGPWNVQGTTQAATANTQHIYQAGSVAIGKDTVQTDIMLDIKGSVRGGNNNEGSVGTNSAAFGTGNKVSGQDAFAAGTANQVSGKNGMALGYGNTVSGPDFSIALGYTNTVSANAAAIGESNTIKANYSIGIGQGNFTENSANYAIGIGKSNQLWGQYNFGLGSNNTNTGNYAATIGNQNTAYGDFSMAIGDHNTAASNVEFVVGRYNAITTGTTDSWVDTDALFQIGNGADVSTPANALTVLKNGNTAIGTHSNTGKPNSTLQVNGSVAAAVRTVTTGSAELTDKDHTIIFRTTENINLTLPDPTTCAGRMYFVINASPYQIIDTNHPIDHIIFVQSRLYDYRNTIQSDGTTWILLSEK